MRRLLCGGNQEHGLRSGTHNVPGIVGLGEAAKLARLEGPAENRRIVVLRDKLLDELVRSIEGLKVYGSMTNRVSGNLNVAFGSIAADTLLSAIPELAVSSGAACSSGKRGASHVLRAMGVSAEEAIRAIRIAIGRDTTQDEVEVAGERLVAAVRRLTRQRAA